MVTCHCHKIEKKCIASETCKEENIQSFTADLYGSFIA